MKANCGANSLIKQATDPRQAHTLLVRCFDRHAWADRKANLQQSKFRDHILISSNAKILSFASTFTDASRRALTIEGAAMSICDDTTL